MAADRLKEWLGRGLALALTLGPVTAVAFAPGLGRDGAIAVQAALPEAGGWQPAALTAVVGEPLRLRLTSRDVMHSFAIAGLPAPATDVKPGEVSEVVLRFDRPGTYTYYCTRWCGPNHWRMRGTIVVRGLDPGQAAASTAAAARLAPYLSLGIDIDAPHPPGVRPVGRPPAARGAVLTGASLQRFSALHTPQRSPARVWRALRVEPALRGLDNEALWDVVAALWRRSTTDTALTTGRALYARNCAACHGVTGAGDGVMIPGLRASLGVAADSASTARHYPVIGRPADFTHPDLLGASPALLHGKILRGGMGTGMPAWGPVLTDAEVWALVDFLYAFPFDYDEEQHHEPVFE
jgi:mono/diheme cytochrome c family protein/plastocyanin